MLEEDAANFDRFLKQSDEKVQQAMRKADIEMKAKQEKVQSFCLGMFKDKSLLVTLLRDLPRIRSTGCEYHMQEKRHLCGRAAKK